MKKAISLLLALLLFGCLGVSAHAEENPANASSKVVYEGARGEYTVTVPLELSYTPKGAPQQDEIELDGQWPSNRTITVSSAATAEIGSKTVNILCPGISKSGSNTEHLNYRENFSTDRIGRSLLTRRGVTNFTVSITPAS